MSSISLISNNCPYIQVQTKTNRNFLSYTPDMLKINIMNFLDFNTSYALSLVNKNFANCFIFPPFRAAQIHLFPSKFRNPSLSLAKMESLYTMAGKFLERLNLHCSHLTDQCFRNILFFCPNIKHLLLGCNANLTNEIFRSLPSALTSLHLTQWNTEIDEASLKALPKTIKSLDFDFCSLRITKLFTDHAAGLESLYLNYTPFNFNSLPKNLKKMTLITNVLYVEKSIQDFLTPYYKQLEIKSRALSQTLPIVYEMTIKAYN